MFAARILRSVAINGTCANRLARWRCSTSLAAIGVGSVNVSDSSEDLVLPVLIVGAGPVGLVLSILLTKLGVKCAVFEKNKRFLSHPQAHFINNRSMEVFRKIDGLAEEIERLQPPVDLWRNFIYCTSLTGQILGTVDQMQPQDFKKIYSPVSVAHFSQYKLTRLLVDRLHNLSSKSCKDGCHREVFEDKLFMGYECVSIDTSSSEWVIAHFSSVENGVHKERKVRCRFLVGADGAGSTVRKLVGITLKGEKELQNLVSVHFQSRDLGNHLLKERPGMLYFVFNSEAIGVIVAHDLKEGEFVLQLPFYPPLHSLEDFGAQLCESTISKLAGRELQDIDVIDIKPWVMNAEVAENYLSNNRVILAGDAAHRFPPAGGFGMNTGIQDAHNLAWKLASVLNGTSPSSYLQTYEAERKPIATFNTALSVQNFKLAMSVPAALGLDPGVAGSVREVISGTVGSFLPSGVQKAIFNTLFSIGRAQASEIILNESNPLGSSRLSKIKKILAEGRSLQLQFPAEDLGFRYLEGALVPIADSSSDPLGLPTGRRREYIPSADPGSRLPHMYVKVLSDDSIEEKFSTLDLIRCDVVEFLLIVAPVTESYALAHAALEVADKLKVSVRVCVMWATDDPEGYNSGSTSMLAPWSNFIDVQQMEDEMNSSSWWDICKMTNRGIILVRPDEHVAWRMKSPIAGNDPRTMMEKVFSVILGL